MYTEDGNALGMRLASFITEKKLKKTEIVDRLRCSNVTLANWLNGDIPNAVRFLAQLRRLYGLDLNWLITNDPEVPNDQ